MKIHIFFSGTYKYIYIYLDIIYSKSIHTIYIYINIYISIDMHKHYRNNNISAYRTRIGPFQASVIKPVFGLLRLSQETDKKSRADSQLPTISTYNPLLHVEKPRSQLRSTTARGKVPLNHDCYAKTMQRVGVTI